MRCFSFIFPSVGAKHEFKFGRDVLMSVHLARVWLQNPDAIFALAKAIGPIAATHPSFPEYYRTALLRYPLELYSHRSA